MFKLYYSITLLNVNTMIPIKIYFKSLEAIWILQVLYIPSYIKDSSCFLGMLQSFKNFYSTVFCSVQFSSVASDSLRPHESQHVRPPLSITNSWSLLKPMSVELVMPAKHPHPFSSCPQSLPASGLFPMSQLFAWGGQRLEFQLQHQSFQWIPRIDLL